ncbi:MAG TPA: ATP-binding protein [Planctomycetota bacterium]|nr:ATP-binding protein [Planctomycetota bacterium]
MTCTFLGVRSYCGHERRRPSQARGTERLTGALLDRLTHRIHILEANGESYRLRESRRRLRQRPAARANENEP